MNSRSSNPIIFMTKNLFGICAFLIVALIIPLTTISQWQGNPVSTAVNNQINPVMTTDGSGGTIITWQDKRNGKYEIYAQRMNSDGNAMWSSNGIAICTQDSNYTPIIVSDGTGGAIIAWQSYRGSATADIFAQRVNSSGSVQWSNNGVPVCVVVFEQDTIAMISDGYGGAILTWQDYRSNNGFADIYAQRINTSGAMIWTANGVNICNQAAAQRGPKLVSDVNGGAFITWYDNRAGNYDIYTQRIATGGAVVWTTNGVATCTMATDQLKPDICSDGAGGVIITWYDFRSTTDFNIYAQRQGPSGAIVWAVDGVVMNNNVAYAQIDPKIVSDGMGGAILSWTDYRTGITADIYAQRVNTTGAVQWTATGVIICTSANDQIKSQIVSDGTNGAYITWEDHRNAGNSDIYAQRIASNAAINWAATGYSICTIGNDQLNPMIVSNGNSGAIVVWQDYRSGNNFDVYETGFNTSGFVAIENGGSIIPDEYSLSQNYPNPFNPSTKISYQLPNAGNVKISIYDALGQNVSVLVNKSQNAGNYSIEWNAGNLPSGVYIYKIEAGSFTDSKKMILVK
ncbi:MAG: T9SS type A sorting domain-containing protein [Ignavibacteria bacterium]